MDHPSLEMRSITKRFGPVTANRQVDFDLCDGEIHALLGENGAGKTTLMRILYGLYSADEGRILIDGAPVQISSPSDAISHRIGMVSQHFTLVPTLTVAENVVLGERSGLRLDPAKIERSVGSAAQRFGIPIRPGSLVSSLSVGERQRVEILKALYREARFLILDEPTAVLVPQEIDALFETLEGLTGRGLSVVFISHKLQEVMAISDRITVLRSGELVGTVDRQATDRPELARMMVGRPTFGVERKGPRSGGRTVLQIENLTLKNPEGRLILKGISLEAGRGEIVGLAGVSGNGQAELGAILAGITRPSAGRIRLAGQDITGAGPAKIAARGVGRIPEERQQGVIAEMSVAYNLCLEHLGDFLRRGVLDRARIEQHCRALIDEYQIKARPGDPIRTLSGGNIQKVILARALARKPQLVLASQPTRGLDVGASEYVRSRLLEERERGAAILLISEDLDEILALSDRILVIYEGRINGQMRAEQATPERLGLLMTGEAVQGVD